MSVLYLVRHGEPLSGWGEPGGSPDPGLSPDGERQAQAAAEALSVARAERPTRVVTSPLRRCRETAAPFARALAVEPLVEAAVAEIPTPAGIEGEARAPWLRAAMAGEWAQMEGIDGQAWRQGVVDALLRMGGAAVFTHFVAINAAVSAAQGSASVLVHRPAPGSVTILRTDGRRLQLVSLGQALSAGGRVL